jgi:hypothetical protein
METNRMFNAKLISDDVKEDEVKSALENLTAQASRSSGPALNIFSQLQHKRAQRIETAAGSLEKMMGADHPQVAVLKQNAAAAGEFKAYYKAQAERVEKRPKLRANEWMVFGRIFDSTGKPAPNLTVRVFDQDLKLHDLLGETETDESGDFAVVYHARDFYEKGENAPELFVMVEDQAGKTLFSSRENIRPQAGRSEYFTIQLADKAAKSAAKKRGRPPKAAAAKTGSVPNAKAAAKTNLTHKVKK